MTTVVERKFAWFPILVNGPNNRKALVWLQFYFKETKHVIVINSKEHVVRKEITRFCNSLWLFSFELNK